MGKQNVKTKLVIGEGVSVRLSNYFDYESNKYVSGFMEDDSNPFGEKFRQETDDEDGLISITEPFRNTTASFKKDSCYDVLFYWAITGSQPILYVVQNGCGDAFDKVDQLIKSSTSRDDAKARFESEFNYCCIWCNGVYICGHPACCGEGPLRYCCTPP